MIAILILNTADATCRVVFVKYKALAKEAGVDAGKALKLVSWGNE